MLKIKKKKTSRNDNFALFNTQQLNSDYKITYTDPSIGSSLGELTETDPCLTYLDQLALTENDCFTSQATDTLLLNQTAGANQSKDIGLDEGLGEPELEEDNQKKIIPRRKKTSVIRVKEPHFCDESKEIRMENKGIERILETDRGVRVEEKKESILSPVNDLGELYDPNQIINELTYRIHQHSKSDMNNEFQPIYKTHRPTIFVEGEEHKEEDSGIFTNLLCSAPTKPKIHKNCSPKSTCELSTTNAITVFPTTVEKRIMKLDRTIEEIENMNQVQKNCMNISEDQFEQIISQKGGGRGRTDQEFRLKQSKRINSEAIDSEFIKSWNPTSKGDMAIKIESHE